MNTLAWPQWATPSDFHSMYIGFHDILKAFNDAEYNFKNLSANYPPYNVLNLGDNKYRIDVSVAGFERRHLSVSQDGATLNVEGGVDSNQIDNSVEGAPIEYMHRGLSSRRFVRKFTLANTVSVVDVSLKNGILSINLVNNLPEKVLPKVFGINDNTDDWDSVKSLPIETTSKKK